MQYWLMKTEPEVFGIDDLIKRPNQTEPWDGVRNYQVRNMLRDTMKPHDLAFFYHSNANPPGIAGIVEIVTSGYPDPSAFNPESKYYDPKSDVAHPTWYLVEVKFVAKFEHLLSLQQLKQYPELHDMLLLRKGNRLSITPIQPLHWDFIVELAGIDLKKDHNVKHHS